MATVLAAALSASLLAANCPELTQRARTHFQARRWAQAATVLEDARLVCVPNNDVLVSLAQARFLLGDATTAIHALEESVAVNPRHVASHYHLGRIRYEQHSYAQAETALKRAVELDPAHHRAWDNLGLVYDALKRDSDALKAFFKSLDLVMKSHPDYDWAHANLADFFVRREQYGKAFQLAAEAAKRNPASARNAFLAGKALAKLGRSESLRWLEQAVKLDASYRDAWYLLAAEYRRLNRPEDAARALERFKAAAQ
ncbi:MAG: tetratricopeptide repeat protein [Acidobacteria bacterium]|nr:tetratricopeptide repeat protein [Acidobacteriota bacterium]